jgi:hypothetical protein
MILYISGLLSFELDGPMRGQHNYGEIITGGMGCPFTKKIMNLTFLPIGSIDLHVNGYRKNPSKLLIHENGMNCHVGEKGLKSHYTYDIVSHVQKCFSQFTLWHLYDAMILK